MIEPLLRGKEITMLAICAVGALGYMVLLVGLRAITPSEMRAALKRR